jgi:hypothetical protein
MGGIWFKHATTTMRDRMHSCAEVWVADHMQFFNGNFQGNIYFTILVHNWEVDLITSFFDLFYSVRLRPGGG